MAETNGLYGYSKEYKKMDVMDLAYRYIQKAYRKQDYNRKKNKGVPIIIYQMGKVGSNSIMKSLKVCGVGPVFHVHRINPENIEAVRREYIIRNQRPPEEWLGSRLYTDVIKKEKMAKFITIVREPIGRNISAFFQNIDSFVDADCSYNYLSAQELCNIFIARYSHIVPLTWFNVEVNQVLGIDVFSYPFPREKGYLFIERNNFQLLIVKSELDDLTKEEVIGMFLGIRNFKLIRSNVGAEKNYASVYTRFVNDVILPETYIETMCSSGYTRHFYTETEIQAIRVKWQRNN